MTSISKVFIILNLILHWNMIYGMIGYDCVLNALTNITTISLLDVGECNIPEMTPQISKTYLQLLRLPRYTSTKVIQCKIEIDRTIKHCVLFPHTYNDSNARMEYILDVTPKQCAIMHQTGMTRIGFDNHVADLKVNKTNLFHSVALAGYVATDGACNGAQYSDPYGTWNQVIVQASVKITLHEYFTRVHSHENKIFLRSGINCTLSKGSCIDIEGYNTFWKPVPDNCDQYDVLYEGMAKKFIDVNSTFPPVFAVTMDQITFALSGIGQQNVCGMCNIIYMTEHPELFIFETEKGLSFSGHEKEAINNIDIFAYINKRFIYPNFYLKNNRTQITLLYHDVLLHKCYIEQNEMKRALSIATIAPDEFAYILMKEPGYTAFVKGEMIHIIKCVPVEVAIRETTSCYNELPVSRGYNNLFLSPKSHILITTGTEIYCNPLVSAKFLINNRWHDILPNSRKIRSSIPRPEYKIPESFAQAGIYTEEDLDRAHKFSMFPNQYTGLTINNKPAITYEQMDEKQNYSIPHFLNKDALNNITNSIWDEIWKIVSIYCQVSAGIIGLVTTLQGIKLFVNTTIHIYALYKEHGCNSRLMRTMWDFVKSRLWHSAKNKEKTRLKAAQDPETSAKDTFTEISIDTMLIQPESHGQLTSSKSESKICNELKNQREI